MLTHCPEPGPQLFRGKAVCVCVCVCVVCIVRKARGRLFRVVLTITVGGLLNARNQERQQRGASIALGHVRAQQCRAGI